MSGLQDRFAQLRARKEKAFIPFVTAGDPNLDFTAEALVRLASAGSALCEIGFPYSDPIADGPVIQASYGRSLSQGTRLSGIFQMLRDVDPRVEIPRVAMVSMAIIRRAGPQAFVTQARDASLAGLIVPDLPLEEAAEFSQLCRSHDLDWIPLITPTTTPERAELITQSASGFIYYVAVTGITGERSTVPTQLAPRIAWLRERTKLPICIGFGISHPEQAAAIAPLADGVIVGSAIVRRIAEASTPEAALTSVETFARAMVAVLRKPI